MLGLTLVYALALAKPNTERVESLGQLWTDCAARASDTLSISDDQADNLAEAALGTCVAAEDEYYRVLSYEFRKFPASEVADFKNRARQALRSALISRLIARR